MILTSGDSLKLPSGVIPRKKKTTPVTSLPPLAEMEAEHIRAVLEHTQGLIAGQNGAAMILDMNPNTLRSRMEKLRIKVQRSEIS